VTLKALFINVGAGVLRDGGKDQRFGCCFGWARVASLLSVFQGAAGNAHISSYMSCFTHIDVFVYVLGRNWPEITITNKPKSMVHYDLHILFQTMGVSGDILKTYRE
jgi:hypothetical protein